MSMDAISLATLAGNRLSPGRLCLVLRVPGRDFGAFIHPTQRGSSFASGEAQAAVIASGIRNRKVFEQKLLKHVARRVKASDPADYNALGALATWLLISSDEWPFLRPHAETGTAVLISIEPQRNGSLKLWLELWESRIQAA